LLELRRSARIINKNAEEQCVIKTTSAQRMRKFRAKLQEDPRMKQKLKVY